MRSLWQNRVTIITGGYGSGKTEVSINLSLSKRRSYPQDTPISLVDLDIVNPYFRSRDKIVELESRGVTIVAPAGDLRTADLPALPPSIRGSLIDKRQQVIIDVGGDPAGATALGRFKPDLQNEPYDFMLVVNPNRPHTGTPGDIVRLLRLIEEKSRLVVTALVNNANLMEFTTVGELVKGQGILNAVEAQTGISTAFVSCVPELAEEVRAALPQHEILPLLLTMRPPWKDADKI